MKHKRIEYTLRCFQCGKDKDLCILPHRFESRDGVVGMIVCCGECFKIVQGKSLKIEITECVA